MVKFCQADTNGRCTQCGAYMRPGFIQNCPSHRRSESNREVISVDEAKEQLRRNRSEPLVEKHGLGDRLAEALASIGVTEDRYKQVKELFGLPPTCNCSGRKEWLNKVSDWWNQSPASTTTTHSS